MTKGDCEREVGMGMVLEDGETDFIASKQCYDLSPIDNHGRIKSVLYFCLLIR